MSFFDDDPFQDIVNEFFGRRSPRTSSSRGVVSESEERVIDYIEENGDVYFVFELLGFDEKDIDVRVKGGNIDVIASKKNFENVKEYLKTKFSEGVTFSKTIPVKVKKDFQVNFKNGILEVKFKRK